MSMATYNAKQLSEFLGCSDSMSYKLIKQMNSELEAKGFITLRGKVSRDYVHLRFYCGTKEGPDNGEP